MFDPLINKNMLNMKADKLQRQKTRAEKVANKLGTLEKMIS